MATESAILNYMNMRRVIKNRALVVVKTVRRLKTLLNIAAEMTNLFFYRSATMCCIESSENTP